MSGRERENQLKVEKAAPIQHLDRFNNYRHDD